MKPMFAAVALFCALILQVRTENYADLNNGLKMPVIGLGTSKAHGDALDSAIDTALEAGYRHIDTATLYKNEEEIGRAIKRWIDAGKIARKDLFLVTKLPRFGLRADLVSHFLDNSLKKLQVDYVDMYLVHQTIGFNYQGDEVYNPVTPEGLPDIDYKTNLSAIWKVMEEQVDAGKAKSIGISNFNESQITKILNEARIKPTNLQVELHPYFQQKELVDFCKKNSIVVTAYAPFGSPGSSSRTDDELNDPVAQEIASKHNKTIAQVLLKHCVQKGLVCIPKSTNPLRIRQNIDIFDFELDSGDLEKLNALDKGPSARLFTFDWQKGMKEHPEYPFNN